MALQKFLTGFRLVTGESLNKLVDVLNGITAGSFKGPVAATTLSSSGVYTPTGGIAAAAGYGVPTIWHTGEVSPTTTTTGTDTIPVVTEVYIARVFVANNTTLTGISLLNGSAVAGNLQGILYDRNGVPLASTASTAQAGTAAYQQVPFTTPLAIKGPASYFLAVAFNNTSARFRSHILGNFVSGKATGATFGTPPNPITIPTGFAASLGPIADTY